MKKIFNVLIGLVFNVIMIMPVYADLEKGRKAYDEGNYKTAYQEWLKSAEVGNSTSQYRLGLLLLNGLGVKEDAPQALKWFQKSANKGHSRAQIHLGFLYRDGKIVNKNYKQAIFWFEKSAFQGEVDGHIMLGLIYRLGSTEIVDYIMARLHYSLIERAGNQELNKVRLDLEKLMTKQQILIADRMLVECEDKNFTQGELQKCRKKIRGIQKFKDQAPKRKMRTLRGRMISAALDGYGKVAGAWFLNEKCKFIQDEKRQIFEKNMAAITVSLGKNFGSSNILFSIQRSSKSFANQVPYSNCGEKSKEIFNWGVKHAEKWSRTIRSLAKK